MSLKGYQKLIAVHKYRANARCNIHKGTHITKHSKLGVELENVREKHASEKRSNKGPSSLEQGANALSYEKNKTDQVGSKNACALLSAKFAS
eukprot:snap_masked-scaffold_3-processed-gene-1.28-mRNA-1 protein AED:1.00 eAED:1.00 QI:0/0/0/0/1/1/2/0/91